MKVRAARDGQPKSPPGSRSGGKPKSPRGTRPAPGTKGNPIPNTGGDALKQAREQGRHPTCGARKKNGEPCRNYAGQRTTHKGVGPCFLHGGHMHNHRKRAALVLAEREVGALAPAVADADVNEISHIRRTLRVSASRLLGWERYVAGLSIEDTLTPEGQFIIDAERKERLAGGRIAMYAQSMGLTALEIRLAQGQAELVSGAVVEALDLYVGGYASHEQRALLGAALRLTHARAEGAGPEQLARLEAAVEAARAAVEPEPVEADVVEADREPPAPEPVPIDTVWREFERTTGEGKASRAP